MKTLTKIVMSFGLGLSLAILPAQGVAALKQGTKAPDFTLNAAQGGKVCRCRGPGRYFVPARKSKSQPFSAWVTRSV